VCADPTGRAGRGRGRAVGEGDGELRVALAVLAIGLPHHHAHHVWHAPRPWLVEATCIHQHEGAWDDDTGNGYAGGMQFTLYTWNSVSGRRARALLDIAEASPREQLHRAYLVWLRDGRSWREWGTAGACGLR
jgi:hypothetical protein